MKVIVHRKVWYRCQIIENVYISLATSMSKTGKFQLTPLVHTIRTGLCFFKVIKIGQVVLAQSVTPFWKTRFWENAVKVFVDRACVEWIYWRKKNDFFNPRHGSLPLMFSNSMKSVKMILLSPTKWVKDYGLLYNDLQQMEDTLQWTSQGCTWLRVCHNRGSALAYYDFREYQCPLKSSAVSINESEEKMAWLRGTYYYSKALQTCYFIFIIIEFHLLLSIKLNRYENQ